MAAVLFGGRPPQETLEPGGTTASGLAVPAEFVPEALRNGRAIGPDSAPAELVVWSDFQCPACGSFSRIVEPRLIRDYVRDGRLRILYRDMAFLGDESADAAIAARCAGEQDAFWPYHDFLFWNQEGENQGAFRRDRLVDVARALNLDVDGFQACLDSDAPRQATEAETAEGRQAGIVQTPSLVIDGHLIPGAPVQDAQYQQLRQVIDQAIAKGSPAGSSGAPGSPAGSPEASGGSPAASGGSPAAPVGPEASQ